MNPFNLAQVLRLKASIIIYICSDHTNHGVAVSKHQIAFQYLGQLGTSVAKCSIVASSCAFSQIRVKNVWPFPILAGLKSHAQRARDGGHGSRTWVCPDFCDRAGLRLQQSGRSSCPCDYLPGRDPPLHAADCSHRRGLRGSPATIDRINYSYSEEADSSICRSAQKWEFCFPCVGRSGSIVVAS